MSKQPVNKQQVIDEIKTKITELKASQIKPHKKEIIANQRAARFTSQFSDFVIVSTPDDDKR
jgi:hypothetical protein